MGLLEVRDTFVTLLQDRAFLESFFGGVPLQYLGIPA